MAYSTDMDTEVLSSREGKGSTLPLPSVSEPAEEPNDQQTATSEAVNTDVNS